MEDVKDIWAVVKLRGSDSPDTFLPFHRSRKEREVWNGFKR